MLAPVTWFSDFWRPRVVSKIAILPRSEATRFSELYPLIKRQADSTRPTILLGLSNRILGGTSQFDIDHLELIDRLRQPGIPYPPAGTSDRSWYSFLVRLASLANMGRIQEARTLLANLNRIEEQPKSETNDNNGDSLPFPEVESQSVDKTEKLC